MQYIWTVTNEIQIYELCWQKTQWKQVGNNICPLLQEKCVLRCVINWEKDLMGTLCNPAHRTSEYIYDVTACCRPFIGPNSMTFYFIVIILCVTTPLELFKTKQGSTGLFIKCLWKLTHSWTAISVLWWDILIWSLFQKMPYLSLLIDFDSNATREKITLGFQRKKLGSSNLLKIQLKR